MGWQVRPDALTSYVTGLEYREWFDLMDQIRRHVDGRKTVVSRFDGVYPSAVYFFSDLRVVLVVEPTMSIWTQDDVERWKSKLATLDVECLVTTRRDDPVLETVLASFGAYSTHLFGRPVPFEIHCR